MLRLFPFNMHFSERVVRAALGLFVVSAISWQQLVPSIANVHPAWFLLGLYPLVTGWAGTDPFYTLFGLNFRKRRLVVQEWNFAKAARDEAAKALLDTVQPPEQRHEHAHA